jgi:hypothetical protein
MGDDKKTTVQLTRPQEAPTVEMATLPIILGELRQLRVEGTKRGEQTETALKNLSFTVQQNFEIHGGKIRAVEGRVDSLETRANALEAEAKAVRAQIASEGKNAVTEDGVKRQISLTEDQMTAKLAEEAKERETVETKVGLVDTKVDMLSTMLVQSLGLRPPPVPNPDGSIPPEGKHKKEPKNAIEKQTMWTKVAAGLMGVVVAAGTLREMGFFMALKKLFLGHE